jgi:hypothetical protein
MTEEPRKNAKTQLPFAVAHEDRSPSGLAPNVRPAERLSSGQRDESSFPTEEKSHFLSSLTSFPSVQKTTPHRSNLDDPLLPVPQLMAHVTVLRFGRPGADETLYINRFSCN